MSGAHTGFELVREQSISELDTGARLFRHRRTGAEVLSLTNRDENKSFAITFRTLPPMIRGLRTSSSIPCSAAQASTR